MPSYNLSSLGDTEFERLSQSLLKRVIGPGTTTFGAGRDGGREATFTGTAAYPSTEDRWSGEWLFQAKFHDIGLIGIDKARAAVVVDFRNELTKLRAAGRSADNYIFITNVPLSAVPESGQLDVMRTIGAAFVEFPNQAIWGGDDVARFLEAFPEVRVPYLQFLTSGDLIAKLLGGSAGDHLAETIDLYLTTRFERDRMAALEQAGEATDEPVPLERVFVDLDVRLSEHHVGVPHQLVRLGEEVSRALGTGLPVSSLRLLLDADTPRCVVIGGPGEGKSTIGQFVAQVHRAALTSRMSELDYENRLPTLTTARIPFRVVLRELAQWLVIGESTNSVEAYLAKEVSQYSGRDVDPETIQELVKANPVLVVFDGLDEITDRHQRSATMRAISEFIARCDGPLKANLQVIATSRPKGYSEEFDVKSYLHVSLVKLDHDHVRTYMDRWIVAKRLDEAKASRVREVMGEVEEDSNVKLLLQTPLQVTIMLVVVLAGGTPPRQREALFDEYVETIYRRENSKFAGLLVSDKQVLLGLHAYLAFVLHSGAAEEDVRSTVSAATFRSKARDFLRSNDPISSNADIDKQAGQLEHEATDRLVLLVGLEGDQLGFELRSLQEYFAASYLVDTARDTVEREARFKSISLSSHWRNVALFFAGRVGRTHPGESAVIVDVCRDLDRDGVDRVLRRGALLAAELAADRAFGTNRRNQRSLVEVALSAIETEVNYWPQHEITDSLGGLPQEDLHDHVMAVLDERSRVVSLRYVDRMLDLAVAMAPELPLPMRLLTRALASRNPRRTARALSLSLLCDPTAARKREWAVTAQDFSVSDLFRVIAGRPRGTLAIVPDPPPDEAFSVRLLSWAMTHSWVMRREITGQLDESTLQDDESIGVIYRAIVVLRDLVKGSSAAIPVGSEQDLLSNPLLLFSRLRADEIHVFPGVAAAAEPLQSQSGPVPLTRKLQAIALLARAAEFANDRDVAALTRHYLAHDSDAAVTRMIEELGPALCSPAFILAQPLVQAGIDEELIVATMQRFAGADGLEKWRTATDALANVLDGAVKARQVLTYLGPLSGSDLWPAVDANVEEGFGVPAAATMSSSYLPEPEDSEEAGASLTETLVRFDPAIPNVDVLVNRALVLEIPVQREDVVLLRHVGAALPRTKEGYSALMNLALRILLSGVSREEVKSTLIEIDSWEREIGAPDWMRIPQVVGTRHTVDLLRQWTTSTGGIGRGARVLLGFVLLNVQIDERSASLASLTPIAGGEPYPRANASSGRVLYHLAALAIDAITDVGRVGQFASALEKTQSPAGIGIAETVVDFIELPEDAEAARVWADALASLLLKGRCPKRLQVTIASQLERAADTAVEDVSETMWPLATGRT